MDPPKSKPHRPSFLGADDGAILGAEEVEPAEVDVAMLEVDEVIVLVPVVELSGLEVAWLEVEEVKELVVVVTPSVHPFWQPFAVRQLRLN